MIDAMTFITDFADQAVVLPLVAVIALVLAALGRWRRAMLWLVAVGVTFGTVLTMKLCLLACGPVFGPFGLHSPSGHTAAAAMVVGGLVAILTGRPSAALMAALPAAAVIGLSRVTLGFHSVPEVVTGGLAGCLGAVGLACLAGRAPVRRPVPLLAAVVAAVVLHGVRLPAEAAIWHASNGLLDFVPACRSASGGPL